MTGDDELTPEAAEEAALLSQRFPWDTQWPAMFRWLQSWWEELVNNVMAIAKRVWDNAVYWGRFLWNWLVDRIEVGVEWVVRGIRNVTGYIWERLQALWNVISNLAKQVWDTVSDVVSSWAGTIWEWIKSLWDTIGDWFSSLGATIANFFTNLWQDISSAFTWLGREIVIHFQETWRVTKESFDFLGRQMAQLLVELPALIERKVIDPILDWLSNAWQWFVTFIREDLIGGIVAGFQWLSTWASRAVGNIIEAIVNYIAKITRIDPTNAPTVAGGLITLTGVMVLGLSTMTIAGELMHPMKELGFGHVSAMIGDCVNYKAISGAFMGALVGAAMTTPLRYYFNFALRPWLPGPGEIAESMSRDLFIDPDSINPELADGIRDLVGPDGGVAFEKRLLGYRGFHDEYYPMFKELANSRVGYFALAGIARGGVFDEKLFKGDLMRAGYFKPIRELLLDMYRRSAIEEAKGLYIGYPMGAFREGWFSEERLSRELIECGIPEPALPKYRHAAWIMYEVDLLSDRLAGLKDAYRKGLVTDGEFSGSLTGWGMASERAAEHLHREQIRRYGKPQD